jgi:hypothetical protein
LEKTLFAKYNSNDQVEEDEMCRALARIREKRNAYWILGVKPDRNRPIGTSRHRWVENIKMDHREIGWGGMGWSDLAQDRDKWRALVNTVMNHRVP